jgi:hypothetical protein
MASRTVIICAQCSAVVEVDPVGLGDELFCCLGCVGGGPCICERQGQDTLSLRVGPFATQADLLRFAARLERAPGLLKVELTQPDLQEARFSVVALSADVLALAVEANPDFSISVETGGSTVHGRISTSRRARPVSPSDEMLPSRMRFRVFRPLDPPDAAGATERPAEPRPTQPRSARLAPDRHERSGRLSPGTGERTTEAEVAELLANARAAASMLPRSAPPPRRTEAASAPVTAGTDAEPESSTVPVSTLAIVGAPFRSFVALNEFQGVVRALPGVQDTRVRRFYGGTLNLSVEYTGAVPFVERLRAASGGAWTVIAATADRIELRLSEAGAITGSPYHAG